MDLLIIDVNYDYHIWNKPIMNRWHYASMIMINGCVFYFWSKGGAIMQCAPPPLLHLLCLVYHCFIRVYLLMVVLRYLGLSLWRSGTHIYYHLIPMTPLLLIQVITVVSLPHSEPACQTIYLTLALWCWATCAPTSSVLPTPAISPPLSPPTALPSWELDSTWS